MLFLRRPLEVLLPPARGLDDLGRIGDGQIDEERRQHGHGREIAPNRPALQREIRRQRHAEHDGRHHDEDEDEERHVGGNGKAARENAEDDEDDRASAEREENLVQDERDRGNAVGEAPGRVPQRPDRALGDLDEAVRPAALLATPVALAMSPMVEMIITGCTTILG